MKHALKGNRFPIASEHINISKLRSGPKWLIFSNPLTYSIYTCVLIYAYPSMIPNLFKQNQNQAQLRLMMTTRTPCTTPWQLPMMKVSRVPSTKTNRMLYRHTHACIHKTSMFVSRLLVHQRTSYAFDPLAIHPRNNWHLWYVLSRPRRLRPSLVQQRSKAKEGVREIHSYNL